MKPTLLVLAAGMGSRYGGLKQLDPLGPDGETIMDYSIYDALKAGFGRVVFVIRHDFEQEFRQRVLSRYEGHVPVDVVFQSVDALPEGYQCPPDRTKPWGTNHAVLMAKDVIHEPFAVINADDFYGRDAFEVMARELQRPRQGKGDYCMVAFRVGNTVTDNGTVSRGVCEAGDDGCLRTVTERTAISSHPDGSVTYNEDGRDYPLDPKAPVSMNLWGFTPDYFDYSDREFRHFLDQKISTPKSEYYIPWAVDQLIRSGEARVKMLDTASQWFGVTYAADRPTVVEKFASLHRQGLYPSPLFK